MEDFVFSAPRVSFSSFSWNFAFPALPTTGSFANTTGSGSVSEFSGWNPHLPKWTPQGLSLHGLVSFEDSATKTMKNWLKTAKSWAEIGGLINQEINLEADLPIGVDFIENSLRIQDAVFKLHTKKDPWFVLGAVLRANIYDNETQDPSFLIEGLLYTDHICLQGMFLPALMPAGAWNIPVGQKELEIRDADASICYYPHPTVIAGTNHSVTGTIGGGHHRT